MQPTNTDDTKEKSYKDLVVLLICVVAIWALSGWTLHSVSERGTFGDMFGAVNALFSGLAFASLIYTIFLQRNELQLQRQELGFTREELKGQKLQLEAQNQVMRLQNFENTFFQLLKLLNDIINSIDLVNTSNNRVTTGRDCFKKFYANFYDEYHKEKRQVQPLGENRYVSEIELINSSYGKFYIERQGDLGHYFRTLYNIIKFIKESDIENKTFYTNLVRAQLSNQELLVIFYNCLSIYGCEKFKPLIEEFSLLKTIGFEDLLDKQHKELYGSHAYAIKT